jgi:hypothetical protein
MVREGDILDAVPLKTCRGGSQRPTIVDVPYGGPPLLIDRSQQAALAGAESDTLQWRVRTISLEIA